MSLPKIIIVFVSIFIINACCSQKNIGSYDVKNTLWRKSGDLQTLKLKCNGRYKIIIVNHLLGGKNSILKGKWIINQDTLTLQRKKYWEIINEDNLTLQKRKRPYLFNYFLIDAKSNLYKLKINESGKLELTEDYWFPRTRKKGNIPNKLNDEK